MPRRLSVRNPQGALVPEEKLEHDETSRQLTWSTLFTAPRDGSADGEYTITATFIDFTERRFTQDFTFVFRHPNSYTRFYSASGECDRLNVITGSGEAQ